MPRLAINTAEPLHRKVSLSLEALVAAQDADHPAVMVRGTELVRLAERGELESLSPDALSERLSRHAEYFKLRARVGGGETRSVEDPPGRVVHTLIARDSDEYPGLPHVDRVVDVPVLTPELDLITEPGLHQASGIYYRPGAGLEDLSIPGEPTTEDVDEAVELLALDYMGDFGFADDGGLATALALLLLPFVREAIPGPTPMHLILAPDIGSGKTTLAQAALLPGCGLVPARAGAQGDDEWRKRITSALLGGTSAILLDNLTGKLESAALAAALTTGIWSDRVLGESREVRLLVRSAWVATGNNLALSPEQARRTVPVFLDPGSVRPADRPRDAFRHSNLLGWGQRNRRRLVEAALTLVQHWRLGAVAMVEGGYVYVREPGAEPPRGGVNLGSYEGWSEVVGGVLKAAGVGGFLSNRGRLIAEADDDSREAREFLGSWFEETGEPVQFKQLEGMCREGGALNARLPTPLLTARPSGMSAELLRWLKAWKGKRAGEYQLVARKLGGHGGPRGWQVVRRDPSAIDPAPEPAPTTSGERA